MSFLVLLIFDATAACCPVIALLQRIRHLEFASRQQARISIHRDDDAGGAESEHQSLARGSQMENDAVGILQPQVPIALPTDGIALPHFAEDAGEIRDVLEIVDLAASKLPLRAYVTDPLSNSLLSRASKTYHCLLLRLQNKPLYNEGVPVRESYY